jgi:hypothetical protein
VFDVQDVASSFNETLQKATMHLKKVVSQVCRSKDATAKFNTLFQEKLQDIEVQIRADASLPVTRHASGPKTLAFIPSDSKSKSTKRVPAAYEGKHSRKRVKDSVFLDCIMYCCLL